MKAFVLALLLTPGGCGDQIPGPADALAVADMPPGDLFGEPCTQPTFPEVGICHDGEGACHDEDGGPVCRPFCHVDGISQCEGRDGVESTTDRGACVCVPQ